MVRVAAFTHKSKLITDFILVQIARKYDSDIVRRDLVDDSVISDTNVEWLILGEFGLCFKVITQGCQLGENSLAIPLQHMV